MTVMSEGLLLYSNYIKMGRERVGFKLSSHSHLLKLFAIVCGFATANKKSLGARRFRL